MNDHEFRGECITIIHLIQSCRQLKGLGVPNGTTAAAMRRSLGRDTNSLEETLLWLSRENGQSAPQDGFLCISDWAKLHDEVWESHNEPGSMPWKMLAQQLASVLASRIAERHKLSAVAN